MCIEYIRYLILFHAYRFAVRLSILYLHAHKINWNHFQYSIDPFFYLYISVQMHATYTLGCMCAVKKAHGHRHHSNVLVFVCIWHVLHTIWCLFSKLKLTMVNIVFFIFIVLHILRFLINFQYSKSINCDLAIRICWNRR